MGTNYYARRILTEDEIIYTIARVERYLRGEETKLSVDIDTMNEKIHLGKLSSGWQFLWQENRYCYDDNLESIKRYLNRRDILIYDEYGDKLTPDEFFAQIRPSLYRDEKHIDTNDYVRQNPYAYPCRTEWTSEDGLRFDSMEFS